MACAAGIANMEVFESQGLLENALEVGPYMQEQLRTLSDLPIVGDIRLASAAAAPLGNHRQQIVDAN